MTIFVILMSLLFVQDSMASNSSGVPSLAKPSSSKGPASKISSKKKSRDLTSGTWAAKIPVRTDVQPECFKLSFPGDSRMYSFYMMLPEAVQKNLDKIWHDMEIRNAGVVHQPGQTFGPFEGFYSKPFEQRLTLALMVYLPRINQLFTNAKTPLSLTEGNLYLGLLLAKLGDPGCLQLLEQIKGDHVLSQIKDLDQKGAYRIFATTSMYWSFYLKEKTDIVEPLGSRATDLGKIHDDAGEYIGRYLNTRNPSADQRVEFLPHYFEEDIQKAFKAVNDDNVNGDWLDLYLRFSEKLSQKVTNLFGKERIALENQKEDAEKELKAKRTALDKAKADLVAVKDNPKMSEADEKKAQRAVNQANGEFWGAKGTVTKAVNTLADLEESVLRYSFHERMAKSHYQQIKKLKDSVKSRLLPMKDQTLSKDEVTVSENLAAYLVKLDKLIKALPDFEAHVVKTLQRRQSIFGRGGSSIFSSMFKVTSPEFGAVETGTQVQATRVKTPRKSRKSKSAGSSVKPKKSTSKKTSKKPKKAGGTKKKKKRGK